jgi:multiple sugar transport system substrate-binding protein
MKRMLVCAAFVLAVGALLLSACSKRDTGVQFWHAMGGPLGDSLDVLVAEYNRTHPGQDIQSIGNANYEALSQKIMGSVAAGQPPVLAQVYEAWTAELIENGSVEPLTEFVSGPNGLSAEELADFLPGMLENNTWDGVLYSVPFNKSVRALYWNKDLFATVGLDRAPTTWAEYMDYAGRLTKDLDGDGLVDQWGSAGEISAWMFENLLIQNGGSIVTPDGTATAFESPAGVEALEFMVKLLTEYGKVTGGYEYQNDFQAGKVGMIEGSTVSLSFMKGKYTFDMATAPLPAGKQSGCLVAGTNVVIFADAPVQQKEAAWEFIRWFTSPEVTARWAAATGYAPVRKSAMDMPVMKQRFEEVEGWRGVFDQFAFAGYEPRTPAWYAGRKALQEVGVESALRKQKTPLEALTDAAAAVNAELSAR